MTQLSAVQSTPHPAATLCAYAESIVRGRRVVVIGDALLGLGEGLVDRGARLVHVYDPDPARVAVATARSAPQKGARPVYALLEADFGVRDGAFDVVIVPDLSVLADHADIVRRARRLLPPNGVALFAAPNPEAERWLLPPSESTAEAPGYYELYDLVALQFSEVRMLGQAPFVGYALVDFAAEDPQVSVDTSILAQPEVPEWFVAVASERRVELEPYALVEIALADVARAVVAPEPGTLRPGNRARDDREAEATLREAQTRIAMLVSENERLTTEMQLTSFADESRHRTEDTLSMRVAELEQQLQAAKQLTLEADGRSAEAHLNAQRLEHQVRDLEEESLHQRERSTRLAKQLDEEKKNRVRAEESAAALRTRSSPPPQERPTGSRVGQSTPPPPPDMMIDARERAEARDRALSLLSELATRDTRIAELEEALALASDPPTLRSIQNAQAARIVELERQAEGLDRQLAEIKRLGEAADNRAKARERELEAARSDVDMARRAVEVQRRELDSLQGKLEESRNDVAALKREVEGAQALIPELQKEIASRPSEEALTEAHAKELSAIEEALRERGHVVAQLKSELRESERIGRELIADNEALREKSAGGSSGSPVGGPLGDASSNNVGHTAVVAMAAPIGETELAELTERAARNQADLASAGWRIAQLEREIEARPKEPRPASERQRELEQALILAHRELAEVRMRHEGQRAERVDPLSLAPNLAATSAQSATDDRAP